MCTHGHRQRHIHSHPCSYLHSTRFTPAHSPSEGALSQTHSQTPCVVNHSSVAACLEPSLCARRCFEFFTALSCLIPTLVLRGRDVDYPYYTGEETEVQRGEGTWRTTGNSITGSSAQTCLSPRPGLTAIMCSCLLDTPPRPVYKPIGTFAQPHPHKHP